jgi:hypothetical protein
VSGSTGGSSSKLDGGADALPPDAGSGADAASGPVDVTLTTDPYDILAASDGYWCQAFRNPFGFDAAIIRSESIMPDGAIELLALHGAGFQSPITIGNCSGPMRPGDGSLHEASELDTVIAYPPGVGRLLLAGENILIYTHVVLASSNSTNVRSTVKLRAVRANEVTQVVSPMYLESVNGTVAAHSSGSVTRTTSPLPFDIELLRGVGRMFSYGTHFHATSGNQTLDDATDWRNPRASTFSPPLHLAQGATVTFTCDYVNSLGALLGVDGTMAITHDRCAFYGVFYPSSSANSGVPIDAILY